MPKLLLSESQVEDVRDEIAAMEKKKDEFQAQIDFISALQRKIELMIRVLQFHLTEQGHDLIVIKNEQEDNPEYIS